MSFTLFITWLCVNFGLLYGLLDDRLHYFETLHHDTLRHQITKRDVENKPDGRILEYASHKRNFKLILHRNTDVFSSDFRASVVDEENRQQNVDVEREFYQGFEESEPESSQVTAYWEAGNLMSAAVETNSDVYILEPSHYHLPRSNNYTLIAYRSSDLKSAGSGREMRCGHVSDAHSSTSHAIDDDHGRPRRSASVPCPDVTKKRCPLLLVADHRFHKALGHDRVSSTVHHLVDQIMRVNEIFTKQMFGECQDGFGFQIQRVIVQEKATSGYNSEKTDWVPEDFLHTFALEYRRILHNFCLAHLFTAISFEDNVMGLAGIAGICNTYNVGFTTYSRTSDEIVYTREAVLITAHELGHNFGSLHDNSDECVPSGSKGGKYLMYPYAVSGLDGNNKVFSPCSRRAIERHLRTSSSCFKEKSHKNCGNYQLDDGEECDEVAANVDFSCCDRVTCKLKPGAVCSDQSSSCCQQCQIADKSKVCYKSVARDCRKTTYCNGTSQHCPQAEFEPNGKECYRGLCFNGECKTQCEYHNLTSCLCDRVDDSCKWCCVNNSADDKTCKPYEFDSKTLPDGTPCVYGHCVEGVCQRQKPHTIRRILELIRTVGNFEKFMCDNIVGTVLVLSLIIWIPLVRIFQSIEKRQQQLEVQKDRWLANSNKELISQDDRIDIIKSKSVYHRKQ